MISARTPKVTTILIAIGLILSVGWQAWGQMPRSFAIGTNQQGSLFYAAGSNLGKVLSKHLPVPARVQPFAGTSIVIPLINNGELELGINNTNDARMAYRGLKPFLPSPKLRVVTVLFTLRVAALVRNNSGIKTLADLKGKRVAGGFKAQLAVWYNATSIMAGAGLDWDDVKMVPTANVVTGTNALIEGRVDATWFAIGAPKVREANAKIPGGIRFVSINTSPSAIAKMQSVMPGTYPLKVKKGPPGVISPITVEGYDVFVVTGTHISDQATSTIVKALYNNEEELKASFRPFRGFSKKRMAKPNVTVPYHTGSIKAFKELGLWSQKMQGVQDRLLREAAK